MVGAAAAAAAGAMEVEHSEVVPVDWHKDCSVWGIRRPLWVEG